MQQAVGHSYGDGESQDGVHDADGIDAAVAPKHLAEKEASDQSERGEDRAGQVGRRKKRRSHPNRGRTAEQLFATREEKRLQDELLDDGPDDVLPG